MSDIWQVLEKYKGYKTAVYGLGAETEKFLMRAGDLFEIAGLLDGCREEGALYGKPILSFDEAVKSGVKLILVAARPGSCKVIAKRIGKACMDHHICLIDIRGRDLCGKPEAVYDLKNRTGYRKRQLFEAVCEKNALSIDLFDTLIMRNTLFASDVFEIVDRKLKSAGVSIDRFPALRMNGEKYLSQSRAPSLIEIYEWIIREYAIEGVSAEEMAGIEWETDLALIVPRKEMCSFAQEVFQAGRNVYIVTDTYYSRKQIEEILDLCGIAFYTDILVSCEYGVGKTQGLFQILKDKTEGDCIHIGDDRKADVESAEKSGLSCRQIYSGADLLEAVGYFGMWDHINSLSDRIKTGMLAARVFNSPFQFETDSRQISVESAGDIGYMVFAPMITDFVIWFREEVQKNRLENILFCARDGFLIQKLYDRLDGRHQSIYFLTSRAAAVRAGAEDETDIRYIERMRFSGTLEEQMQERFGIRVGNNAQSSGKTCLTDYTADILKKAQANKRNYRKYIEKSGVRDGSAAFFDFVAKGTCQMFMGRILTNPLKGLYFLRQEKEDPKTKELDILSFYELQDLKESAIFDNYYILEAFLTSDMPMVTEFDEYGNAVYAAETRSSDDIRCIREVQEGIEDYFERYLEILGEGGFQINRELDEKILLLIHKTDIRKNQFLKLKIEDCFFNRTSDLENLI